MELARNKKAFFDYEILHEWEAGIMLKGHEVKSIRKKQVNLKGSYVSLKKGEAFIEKMLVSPYQAKNQSEGEQERSRKLLLHKQEIDKMERQTNTPGNTLVPLKLLLKKNKVKVIVAAVRGKKSFDKRESIKKRDLDRQLRGKLKKI